MKTKDQQIRDLIVRHVFLTCENYLEYSRVFTESMDRIEQEYIVLTRGLEIRTNPAYIELLKKRCEYLKIEVC